MGQRDQTNEYVIPKILFLGANNLSGRLALTYNIGPSFITALTRLFQIDIRGGLGLVDNEPNWLAGAGLAFRVPD